MVKTWISFRWKAILKIESDLDWARLGCGDHQKKQKKRGVLVFVEEAWKKTIGKGSLFCGELGCNVFFQGFC